MMIITSGRVGFDDICESKNACEIGWFDKKESEELLNTAYDIGKIYFTLGNVINTYGSSSSALLTIVKRFYRNMKLGPIIVSVSKPSRDMKLLLLTSVSQRRIMLNQIINIFGYWWHKLITLRHQHASPSLKKLVLF